MIEPEHRLRKYRIKNTIVFFGSTRTLPKNVALKNLKKIENEIKRSGSSSIKLNLHLEKAKNALKMSQYYEDACELSRKLSSWFKQLKRTDKRFVICTGGGPGIMEAANRGAQKAKERSIGLNISLPMEQYPNPYQTKDISFEFHYFFIRKFWFFYLAKALIIFPGGYGTFDELFELLTIIQTGKSKKHMPVILYGKDYWEKVLNFSEMVKWGTIDRQDLSLFRTCDTVDDAFKYLQRELTKHYLRN
ncbi:MAG: LOG family protein [Candidatus Omnitrophota bacterium]